MTRDRFLPVAAAIAAIALLSGMDVAMKSASLAIGTFSALLLRSALTLAIIGPAWLATRGAPTAPATRAIHVRRGVVMTFMGLSFFWGLARLPVAEALALSFVAPLIALYLAAVLLGERIERRAIGASLLGLAGVAVIALTRIEEGTGALDHHPQAKWGIASILVSSVLYAWNLVLQRQQAQLARPAEVATWQHLVIGSLLALAAPFLLEWPDARGWLFIGLSGSLSLTGALLFAWAYARAEAQILVPLEYSGFVWAALFGWMFLDETVRPPVVAGALLIVLACFIATPRRRPEQSSA